MKRMGKKLYLTLGLVLALVVNAGIFAYAWPSATAMIDVAAEGDIATASNATANQPDWDSLKPKGQNSSDILLPNAPGDETDIPIQYPNSGQHWQKVDDWPAADDEATYVANDKFNKYNMDLYNLTNRTEAEGFETINSVTVYFRFSGSDDGGDRIGYAKAAIKTYGTVFEGNEESQAGPAYVNKSYPWATNPATGKAWTWQEIDDLQAGVSLKGTKHDGTACCTQVYVAVNYEFVITEGEVPIGNLFEITPNPAYNGDLLAMVYLTNTGALRKAYRYLNMKLYVAGLVEAEEPSGYQLLSLENGVVFFNIQWPFSDNYTIEVTGGSYRLVSGDSNEWGQGWSITPEFYCEVTQR